MQHTTVQMLQTNALANWKPANKIQGAVIFFLIGIYMLIAGIIFNFYNNKVKQHQVVYGSDTLIKATNNVKGCTAGVTWENCEELLEIDEDIQGPVYVYYELQSFFQNFQNFIESYDRQQLTGNSDQTDSQQCIPKITNRDMKKLLNYDNSTSLNPDEVAIPCGWRAYTYFNGQTAIEIDENNISWEKDQKDYQNIDLKQQWINVTDEHFQVWMRPSGLSKFRKLWGKVQNGLQKGIYTIQIQNRFNVTQYNSQKTFVVTNLSPIGGQTPVLAIAHIIGGIFNLLFGIILIIVHKREQKVEFKKE